MQSESVIVIRESLTVLRVVLLLQVLGESKIPAGGLQVGKEGRGKERGGEGAEGKREEAATVGVLDTGAKPSAEKEI